MWLSRMMLPKAGRKRRMQPVMGLMMAMIPMMLPLPMMPQPMKGLHKKNPKKKKNKYLQLIYGLMYNL